MTFKLIQGVPCGVDREGNILPSYEIIFGNYSEWTQNAFLQFYRDVMGFEWCGWEPDEFEGYF